jgi:hypothetical protein
LAEFDHYDFYRQLVLKTRFDRRSSSRVEGKMDTNLQKKTSQLQYLLLRYFLDESILKELGGFPHQLAEQLAEIRHSIT